MTGRELIVYILENHLEDKPVFEKGKFIGFMTVGDVAVKENVGLATVYAWTRHDLVNSVPVIEDIYIPVNYESPVKGVRSNGQ